jgi:hypothetical protein
MIQKPASAQTNKSIETEEDILLSCLKVSLSVKVGDKDMTFFTKQQYKIELTNDTVPRIRLTARAGRNCQVTYTTLHNTIYYVVDSDVASSN